MGIVYRANCVNCGYRVERLVTGGGFHRRHFGFLKQDKNEKKEPISLSNTMIVLDRDKNEITTTDEYDIENNKKDWSKTPYKPYNYERRFETKTNEIATGFDPDSNNLFFCPKCSNIGVQFIMSELFD